MGNIVNFISGFLLFSGCAFCLIGALGLLRMPTFITRVHAASLIDSLGAILIISGLILQTGFTLVAVKLALILIFLLLTGPTAIHALVNTALHEDSEFINDGSSSSNT